MLRSLVARAAARVAPVVGSPRAAVRSISSTAARLGLVGSEMCIRDSIPPGSIVMVESYLSAGRSSTTTFAGVLIAVRRAGIATTFLLRTIAHKLGVEMRFHAYSPMIKDIKVIQRADAKKGQPGLLRTRRAKLYYMRRNEDRRVGSVGNVVKQYRAAEQKRADASNASSRRGPASRS